MRLTRVFVPDALSPGAEIALSDSAAAHLTRVLRLGVGDACVVFNGDGNDYAASIAAVGKREARLRIGEASPVERESPLRLVLLQGVAKGEKMDLILQKATELGVHAIVPVWSQ
ncbi:RsmE family RNA methyltransferase, partial [Lysobacter sp.]|uniref:RsmE family RNA methyltransferase n=1 Tax=Lysobacter sp. TaxID=72226 RepID=UPI002D628D3D